MDGGVPAGCFAAKVDLTEDLQGKAAGRDFGGLTFQVVHCFVQAACGLQVQNLRRARARMKKVTDLVKRCDQPGKVLIQT